MDTQTPGWQTGLRHTRDAPSCANVWPWDKTSSAQEFTSEERQAYRAKVHADLDVFARMLADDWFDFDRPMTGTEIELNLTDEHGDPSMRNATVLDAISDPAFQTEVGAVQP